MKHKRKIYLICNSPWKDIERLIPILADEGYYVTNTPLQDSTQELGTADCIMTLRGWDATKRGRMLREIALYFNKPIVSRMILRENI